MKDEREVQTDFIREAIREDLRTGRFDRVHTRFPPEPNAYLHIGHAKAVWIDYGIALEFGGESVGVAVEFLIGETAVPGAQSFNRKGRCGFVSH